MDSPQTHKTLWPRPELTQALVCLAKEVDAMKRAHAERYGDKALADDETQE